jgi:integrase
MAGRRGHGEDGVSFDHRGPCTDPERHRHCPGRWVGQAELPRSPDGKRNRRRVVGKTKTAVLDKLKELHKDLDKGIVPQAGFSGYTVREAAEDFLKTGLDGRSAKTIKKNENVLEPILVVIGAKRLRELTASDVQQALAAMAARYSTAAVIMGHNALTRTIRHAEARDRVGRNVATLVDTPKGQAGRPSKSLTLAQAEALMAASTDSRLRAYITLCLTTGIRTEEARELRWDHLDLNGNPDADPPIPASAAVWRSVRAHGDVKTEKSRRTLMLSKLAVTALREHQQAQNEEKRAAGGRWQDSGLVFTTRYGTALDAANVRREFKAVCKRAGIGEDWTPRELRHSFVSLMSASGVPVEEIARIAGHSSSRTTEVVYRRELRPVLTAGAELMDKILGK